jgi:pheromone a factor receptor
MSAHESCSDHSIRAIFNLMSFQNGPQPLGQRGDPTSNLTIIERVFLNQMSPKNKTVMNLQFFTVIACSYVFFLCFATSEC